MKEAVAHSATPISRFCNFIRQWKLLLYTVQNQSNILLKT
jgi:hypothetical protein